MLILLALVSGVALVGIAGFGLWRSSSDAQRRAAWEQRQDARDATRALRAALEARAVLAHCPERDRFTIRDGAPVLDPDVHWLVPHDEELPPLARERLREARVAEFVDGDAAEAARRHDASIERARSDRSAHGHDAVLPTVLLQAAWQAHRAGCRDRCVALLAEADTELAGLAPEHLQRRPLSEALASSLLLHDTLDQPPSPDALRLLATAPDDVAAPTIARLVDSTERPDPGTARAQSEQAHIAYRRALLRDAATFVRDRSYRGSPQVLTDPTTGRAKIALWFRDASDSADGEGALVDATWLASLRGHDDAGLPPVPMRGDLVFASAQRSASNGSHVLEHTDPGAHRAPDGAPDREASHATEPPPTGDLPPEAEPVLEGIAWIVPSPPPPLPWFSRPGTLLSAAIVLLLLFSASAWATFRGVSRSNQAMRARAEFLTGVTHELKTPIASMRLIADVLHDDRDDLPDAQQQRYLAMLTGEAARLTTLIDNVLDLGQIERGERAYDLQPDCCADAVRETVRGYEALAAHHGLTLELHEGTAAAPARIDRGAIAQALRNLLENARKYAAGGARVEVHTRRSAGEFTVCVRDHGPGIAEAERERIFERFVRGARQRDGSVPGVGLGLFLSREIARRHGGELRCVVPEDGTGAVFELRVPLDGEQPGGRPEERA